MAKVYIAGPMRGYPQFNFPAFDEASKLGHSLGWEVVSPADLDRTSGFQETDEITPALIRQFVERDIGALLDFKVEDGDAIALLPGWERSTGAKGELAVALWLGLRVVDARTFYPMTVEVHGYVLRPLTSCPTGLCSMGNDEEAETYAMKTIAGRIANDPTFNN